MEMKVRDVKRSQFRRMSLGLKTTRQMLCLCAILTGKLQNPMLAQSDQPSITSVQPLVVQGKERQAAKSEESKAKKANVEEGAEKGKRVRVAGCSCIQLVRLCVDIYNRILVSRRSSHIFLFVVNIDSYPMREFRSDGAA